MSASAFAKTFLGQYERKPRFLCIPGKEQKKYSFSESETTENWSS